MIRSNKILFYSLVLSFIICFSASEAQVNKGSDTSRSNDKTWNKIKETLFTWNKTVSGRDVKKVMEQFDISPGIMVIGSDSSEIFKGKEQIEGWLAKLFAHNSFSWEMKRIDIDYYRKTAWVFVDGNMIVVNDKGKTHTTPYRFSGILVKRKSQWKWKLFDGSVPGGH